MRSKILNSLSIALTVALAVSSGSAANAQTNIEHRTSNTEQPTARKAERGGRESEVTESKLLFRMQFAGTKALVANTNAAYLTNFAFLPETAALGTQIVAKVAGLPGPFLRGDRSSKMGDGKEAGTNHISNGQLPIAKRESLRSVFAEMLQEGFTLELRGEKVVTEFAIGAKADNETAKRWEAAWKSVATNGSNPAQIRIKRSGDWFLVSGSKTDASPALGSIEKTVANQKLEAGAVLQGELSSRLIPGPIQRSVYGGFERLTISVVPDAQSMKVRGAATYASDLPKLGALPVVPTNLVTEPAISFTMVREPSAWLEPNSPLRNFFPSPIPDVAWFWGGEGSPYQFFTAVPLKDRKAFESEFGPSLVNHLQPIANFVGTGNVALDTNRSTIIWRGTPFVLPKAYCRESGTNLFAIAETFPQGEFPPGLTPALIERVSNRTDLVLFDWEYITLRFDTWFRIGQLAMLCGNYEQILSGKPSLNLIQKVQLHLRGSGNTSTEITQASPRELSLARRGPLAFTSIELFWLANWLESPNFPAANFLVPMHQ